MKALNILLCALIAFSFLGCMHRNECGYSSNFWAEKSYYYDAQGRYREICPQNIIYRDDALAHDELEDF